MSISELPLKPTRHYLHGDQKEEDKTLYYCERCDLSFPESHFFSNTHVEPDNIIEHLYRYKFRKSLWETKLRWTHLHYRIRPDNPPNLFADEIKIIRRKVR